MSIGPRWLNDPRIASCVVATILRGADSLNHYRLRAYVVMPYHVHLLIDPHVPIARIMRGLKGVGGREANRILDRTGKTFWQDESYDHWVRSEEEVGKVRFYIEWNPVRAGLTNHVEEWKWSSAGTGVRA